MPEYFVVTHSFAAPFVSDQGEHYVESGSPTNALEKVAAEYGHPAGLYAANCYESHKAFLWRETPLAEWRSNHAAAIERATKGKGGYSLLSHGPGDFEVDGERVRVTEPKSGRVTVG